MSSIFQRALFVLKSTPSNIKNLNGKQFLLIFGIFITFFGLASTTREILGCITLPFGGIFYFLGNTTQILDFLIDLSPYIIMFGIFITVVALIFLIPAKENFTNGIDNINPPKWKKWKKRRFLFYIFVYGLIIFHILMVAFGKSNLPSICPQSFSDFTLEGSFGFPFLFWSSALLLVLIFGRALCGWVCVYTPVQEQSADLLTAVGKNPNKKMKRFNGLIYIITALFWGSIIFNIVKNLNNLNFNMDTGCDVGPLWLFFGGIVTMFPLTTFLTHFLGNRSFCKYLCPIGGLMGLYSKFGLLKVKIDKEKCIDCMRCDKNCQMSVEIENYRTNGNKSIKDGNCIACGDCIDSCPTKALNFGIGG